MSSEIQDTIIAVSTPSGRSFHAIIKISGPVAIQCIKDIFIPTFDVNLEIISTYTSVAGDLHIKEELVKIPVVLYIMKQPYSYTKEDVVEIHTIGSQSLVKMLLDAILSEGIRTKKNCRLSQPGEFTKRAFLHGRIDLAQAEATMRLIRAQTDNELMAAIEQLAGHLSQQIKRIQDEIVSLCSSVEAAIDFSDQDIELITAEEILNGLESIQKNISHLLAQSETAKISLEGINTVLCGKPNVGKSSIINALLGRRRSIVSEIPGTTLDIVADILEIRGIRFKLMDTAGINNTKPASVSFEEECVVISGAIAKARATLKKAQLVLLVFDGSADICEQLRETNLDGLTGNIIVIINKCDLLKNGFSCELPDKLKKYPLVYTSAVTCEGIDRLREVLIETVLGGQVNLTGHPLLFNVRQKDVLQRSLQLILQAMELGENNASYEFIALDMRMAIDTLGEIAGEVTTEDILDKIFSEFCIGK